MHKNCVKLTLRRRRGYNLRRLMPPDISLSQSECPTISGKWPALVSLQDHDFLDQ